MAAWGQARSPRPDPTDLPARQVNPRFLPQLPRQGGWSLCATCRLMHRSEMPRELS